MRKTTKTGLIAGAALLALVLVSAALAERYGRAEEMGGPVALAQAIAYAPPVLWEPIAEAEAEIDIAPLPLPFALPPGVVSAVFVEDSTGPDDGASRLFASMRAHGIDLHSARGSPFGLIAPADVVILKINAQWDQRGGTNTDLVRAVIREILAHPDGFTGEIIIADNGQAQFGSAPGGGGSLDWARNNAEDQSQSNMALIRYFQAQGHRVTGSLWDVFTRTRVQEFSEGDMRDGFVVEDFVRPTGITVSYPKFTTEFGTHVSFRHGIWDPATRTYDSESLKVINMPVLKSHSLFQVTAAVKNYMGVPSDWLTRGPGRAHNSVGTGGMGTLLVETRLPVLHITDMIWIGPDRGPRVDFHAAVRTNMIAASLDPVALDYWTARHVLMPAAARLPGGRAAAMNPAGTTPGTFGHWLRLSMNELLAAGVATTMDPAQMLIVRDGVAQ